MTLPFHLSLLQIFCSTVCVSLQPLRWMITGSEIQLWIICFSAKSVTASLFTDLLRRVRTNSIITIIVTRRERVSSELSVTQQNTEVMLTQWACFSYMVAQSHSHHMLHNKSTSVLHLNIILRTNQQKCILPHEDTTVQIVRLHLKCKQPCILNIVIKDCGENNICLLVVK